jgi:hypothetical protein
MLENIEMQTVPLNAAKVETKQESKSFMFHVMRFLGKSTKVEGEVYTVEFPPPLFANKMNYIRTVTLLLTTD